MKVHLLVLFLSLTLLSNAQSIFKNKTTLLTIKPGQGEKACNLKTGEHLIIKEDIKSGVFSLYVFLPNVTYHLANYDCLMDDFTLYISTNDFDLDGRAELVVAYGEHTLGIMKISIYRMGKNNAKEMATIEAQYDCYMDKDKITLPIGSQGLFDEYTFKKAGIFNKECFEKTN